MNTLWIPALALVVSCASPINSQPSDNGENYTKVASCHDLVIDKYQYHDETGMPRTFYQGVITGNALEELSRIGVIGNKNSDKREIIFDDMDLLFGGNVETLEFASRDRQPQSARISMVNGKAELQVLLQTGGVGHEFSNCAALLR